MSMSAHEEDGHVGLGGRRAGEGCSRPRFTPVLGHGVGEDKSAESSQRGNTGLRARARERRTDNSRRHVGQQQGSTLYQPLQLPASAGSRPPSQADKAAPLSITVVPITNVYPRGDCSSRAGGSCTCWVSSAGTFRFGTRFGELPSWTLLVGGVFGIVSRAGDAHFHLQALGHALSASFSLNATACSLITVSWKTGGGVPETGRS